MRSRLEFLLFITFLISNSFADAQDNGFAVVELFTSEGCESCPAGDKILSQLSAEAKQTGKSIYFLEYHVDYWNKGGWKDPFSKNQFTFRQENYSRVLPGKEMYTPQFVINGQAELSANNLSLAKAAIEKARNQTPLLNLTFHVDSLRRDTAFVSYTCSRQDKNYVLRFVLSENNVSSKVTGGQHAGKLLVHDNVVRILFSVNNPAQHGQVVIPLKEFKADADFTWTAFVQHKQSMRILGASRVQ
jgi:hypothetical protein